MSAPPFGWLSTTVRRAYASSASTRGDDGEEDDEDDDEFDAAGQSAFTPQNASFDWKGLRDEVLDTKKKFEIQQLAKEKQAKLKADEDSSKTIVLGVEPEEELDVFRDYEQRDGDDDMDGDEDASDFQPVSPAVRQRKIDPQTNSAQAIGRRKTSAARVTITPGAGKFIINGRQLVDYFPLYSSRDNVLQPLIATESLCQFDIDAVVSGGGVSGQSGAVRHALARALEHWDPDWRPALKVGGFLTRDPRMVERKKTGQPKARKKKQW